MGVRNERYNSGHRLGKGHIPSGRHGQIRTRHLQKEGVPGAIDKNSPTASDLSRCNGIMRVLPPLGTGLHGEMAQGEAHDTPVPETLCENK